MTRRRQLRTMGLVLAAVFAVVGAIFAIIPGGVLAAFNWAGGLVGLPPTPTDAFTLYLALAIAYMYVVAMLALMMARHPDIRTYPWVLVQAKAASALVCLALFVFQERYLIYMVNFVVDGAIAAFVYWIALQSAPQRDHVVRAASGEGQVVGRGPGAARPPQ